MVLQTLPHLYLSRANTVAKKTVLNKSILGRISYILWICFKIEASLFGCL